MYNMMGSTRAVSLTGDPAVSSVEEARPLAQEYAITMLSGATLGDPIASLPVGYRFAVLRDGEIIGVIDVSTYSGVWYDAW
jgi:hypothetical protein